MRPASESNRTARRQTLLRRVCSPRGAPAPCTGHPRNQTQAAVLLFRWRHYLQAGLASGIQPTAQGKRIFKAHLPELVHFSLRRFIMRTRAVGDDHGLLVSTLGPFFHFAERNVNRPLDDLTVKVASSVKYYHVLVLVEP